MPDPKPAADPVAPAVATSANADAPTFVEETRTPWQIMWRKLKRNRLAMGGLWLLVVLYVVALFPGFFSPYSYDRQFRETPGTAPHLWGGIHFWDAEDTFHWRPFVYGNTLKREKDDYGELILVRGEDTTKRHPIRWFVEGDEWHLLGLIPMRTRLFGVDRLPEGAAPDPNADPDSTEGIGRIYPFGSDHLGRCIYSRLIYGSFVSLSVGIVGILISMSLGLLLGGIAGYFGGWTDFLMMRMVEVIMAVPGLYLILTLRFAFPVEMSSMASYFLIVIILALIGWASNARVIRGMVLSLREQDYVIAARALGVSHLTIIVKHILPNTLSYVIVTATLYVPYYILGEVALSFLGVGIQEPEASWGLMLKHCQELRELQEHPWIIVPGVAVFVAVLAYNFLGDGLRDAADPRSVLAAKGS